MILSTKHTHSRSFDRRRQAESRFSKVNQQDIVSAGRAGTLSADHFGHSALLLISEFDAQGSLVSMMKSMPVRSMSVDVVITATTSRSNLSSNRLR